MYKRLFLEIITPDSKIYEGNIALVKVPGSKGSFEVLLNHAPIISTLDSGEIKIWFEGGKTQWCVPDLNYGKCRGNVSPDFNVNQ